ncbi:Protein of unknown function DUF262 [Lutibacter oricola]|uniref:GmrSD restriction endonucleases N-terminal domain-containing protein n=1 Tax=Lutibacter oricola TaxID=762486 RepID=A0A1H3CLM6_9FLAO|nr:DUF262 domain-containing protein [Lutibacter oricola]SDX55063.1 Protein of unknown function DUF262 [Lutibacter oricola]
MNSIPTTFSNIFDKELNEEKVISKIEVPIIQRDYAQGRTSKAVSRIRNGFINAIHIALTGTEKDAIKLDFVYGNIEDEKLIPLDGQQRLTTLFLVHWYIAKNENVATEEQEFLKNFTYKTRFSSQHFCDSLVNCEPDYSCESLSAWIIDQNWFMYSWEQDPTISGMLVMLDEIHSKFKKESNLWQKLTHKEIKPVSFYFLALEDMGLSDSLYVKMNSRGKPLTPFEHFKADFEKVIKEVSIDLYDEFIKKVDINWVDMLWKYRGDDDLIDDEFMRYYRFVTEIICYTQKIDMVENDFDLANKVYGVENENAKTNLKILFRSFDCWSEMANIEEFFNTIFSGVDYEENKVRNYSDTTDLFLLCCNNYGKTSGKRRAFTLNNTILLYAVLQYLLNKDEISESEFTERIRIVRNLVLNSPDEIRETRMDALLSDTFNIIVNGEVQTKSGGFSGVQKNEEINKIEWRKNNIELVEDLNQLEDHNLLQGNIAIIGLEDVNLFKNRAQNFIGLFNNEIEYLKISNALLALGDYSQNITWRCLFGNKTDSSWEELFKVSQKKWFFERTQKVVLELLDAIKGNFNTYLENVVTSFLSNEEVEKDWRYYFLKYPAMRSGNSGVFWWRQDGERIKENQYEIFMMNTALSLNGRHWDPFLYALSIDEDLKGAVSLEEYGAPLVFKNEYIKCMNDGFYFYDFENNETRKIEIPQEEEVDKLDRIELLKNIIKLEY